jgi:hypothetical protein
MTSSICYSPSVAIPKGISAGFRSREKAKAKLEEKEKDDVLRRFSHDEDREAHLAVHEPNTAASGWSLVLEDWFCNGGSAPSPATAPQSTVPSPRPPSAPPSTLIAPGEMASHTPPTPSLRPPQRAFSSDDVFLEPSRRENMEQRKGPYELLTKER